jgi:hypothetical protein
MPVASTVEIDQVQAIGPRLDQLMRGLDWVVGEDRFAVVITLLEADAFAPAKIDGRPNLHGLFGLPCEQATAWTETRNIAQGAWGRKWRREG